MTLPDRAREVVFSECGKMEGWAVFVSMFRKSFLLTKQAQNAGVSSLIRRKNGATSRLKSLCHSVFQTARCLSKIPPKRSPQVTDSMCSRIAFLHFQESPVC